MLAQAAFLNEDGRQMTNGLRSPRDAVGKNLPWQDSTDDLAIRLDELALELDRLVLDTDDPDQTPANTDTRHVWAFEQHFGTGALSQRKELATEHIEHAVIEIKRTAETDELLAAEGAVLFLERLSPRIDQIEGTAWKVNTSVFRAVEALSPMIAAAPAEEDVKNLWLERLKLVSPPRLGSRKPMQHAA